MTDSALACKALGRLPLDYKKDAEGHIHLNEQKTPIVKMIFDRYIKNDKIGDIIAAANEKRYLTSDGKPFTRNSLQHMVNNEIYISTYHWNDIIKAGALPTIISPEIFAMAQLRNQKQKRGNKVFRKSNNYILTTKLKCRSCGGNMVVSEAPAKPAPCTIIMFAIIKGIIKPAICETSRRIKLKRLF